MHAQAPIHACTRNILFTNQSNFISTRVTKALFTSSFSLYQS